MRLRPARAERDRIECWNMLRAITRGVSPSLNRCELSYLERREIDVARSGVACGGTRAVSPAALDDSPGDARGRRHNPRGKNAVRRLVTAHQRRGNRTVGCRCRAVRI